MKINRFKAWRPLNDLVEEVASVPYDVVDRQQAQKLAEGNPNSFLHVVRAEIDLPEIDNVYSDAVYEKAKKNLDRFIVDGILIQEEEGSLYLYSQKMEDHIQYGIVATCHCEEYECGNIKIHEKTRKLKEEDRIRYVDEQNANTGPVFLAYRDCVLINKIVEETKATSPIYHFIADDSVEHTVWKFQDPSLVEKAFANVKSAYVADGHHRSASAVKVASMRRDANPNHTGNENYNYFLSVFFPESELKILPYNRVVKSLDLSIDDFRTQLSEVFSIEANGVSTPRRQGEICMYLEGIWNTLTLRDTAQEDDPVASLDVSILQDKILSPILNICDPRENENIDFIGGIKGTKELERLVDNNFAEIAFSLYPTSMDQLFSVADAGKLMPPKSTWFEPKLRSGLLVNKFD